MQGSDYAKKSESWQLLERQGGGGTRHTESPLRAPGKVLFLDLYGVYKGVCPSYKTSLSYVSVGGGFLYLCLILQQ